MQNLDSPQGLHERIKRPDIEFDDSKGIVKIDGTPFNYEFFSALNNSGLLEKPVKITNHEGLGIFIEEVNESQDNPAR